MFISFGLLCALVIGLSVCDGAVTTKTSDTSRQSASDRLSQAQTSEGNILLYPEDDGCEQPPTISNGSYVVVGYTGCTNCRLWPGRLVSNGWSVVYSCDEGYTLNSTTSSSVCSGNHWTPPLQYACVAEHLCPPLKVQNGNVRCRLQDTEVSCATQMNPGTTAEPSCNLHYRPIYGSEFSMLVCNSDGRWNQPLIECIPVCGDSKEAVHDINPLVYNGSPAHIGLFPWHAGIYFQTEVNGKIKWEQGCGGSLVTDQFVLTAAHCVCNFVEQDVAVALGKYYRSWDRPESTEQKRNVSQIICSSEFNKATLGFDLALLQIDRRIMFGQYIMPVCHGFLDGSNYIADKSLYVVGWGQTQNVQSGNWSETLLYANVTMLPRKVCKKTLPPFYLNSDKFCIEKRNSDISPAQAGDSGGGLSVKHGGLHYIFGIVSTKVTSRATEKSYSTFTNITWSIHMLWIEKQIKKYDRNFIWDENDLTKINNIIDDVHSNQSVLLNQSPKGCVLPGPSLTRGFCRLTDDCEDRCDFYDEKCLVPPGSRLNRVKVICGQGYGTRNPTRVSVCLGNAWHPPIQECIERCRPLKSDQLELSCRYDSNSVDCSEWALPETTVTSRCGRFYKEFSELSALGLYSQVQRCTPSGEWTGYLPPCKPDLTSPTTTYHPVTVEENPLLPFPDDSLSEPFYPPNDTSHKEVYTLRPTVPNPPPGNIPMRPPMWITTPHTPYATERPTPPVNGSIYYPPLPGPLPPEAARPTRPTITTGCVLPILPSTRFCSLNETCIETCSYNNTKCAVPAGTRVDKVKVTCAQGHTLKGASSVSVCLDDEFYPPIEECVKPCPPLISDELVLSCIHSLSYVTCSEWMMPGTTVGFTCATGLKEDFNVFDYILDQVVCLSDGRWSVPLPRCTPVCGEPNKEVQPRPDITSGNIKHGLVPWHAALYFSKEKDGRILWEQKCGGTLLNAQYILTTAECVKGVTHDLSLIRVALGKYHRSWDHEEVTQEKLEVSKITYPSEFHSLSLFQNIALVKLLDGVEFTASIAPACPFSSKVKLQDSNLYVTGWDDNAAATNTRQSDELRELEAVTAVSEEECRRNIPQTYVLFDKTCTVKNASDSVLLQQGGGLTAVGSDGRHYIVGIAGPKSSRVTVNTNLQWQEYIDWMKSEMK